MNIINYHSASHRKRWNILQIILVILNLQFISLGQIIRGDRVVTTAYTVVMAEDMSCTATCDPIKLNKLEKDTLKLFIFNKYVVQL